MCFGRAGSCVFGRRASTRGIVGICFAEGMNGRVSGEFGFHSSLLGYPTKNGEDALGFVGVLGAVTGLGAGNAVGVDVKLGFFSSSLKNPQITVAASASMTTVTINICRLSRLNLLSC